jgi:shikimate kinase
MSEALARHENELLRVGELRKLQENDFRQQLVMQVEIDKAVKEQEGFKKVQLFQELSDQIREDEVKRAATKKEKKDKVCTSGGPTMINEDTVELLRKFKN